MRLAWILSKSCCVVFLWDRLSDRFLCVLTRTVSKGKKKKESLIRKRFLSYREVSKTQEASRFSPRVNHQSGSAPSLANLSLPDQLFTPSRTPVSIRSSQSEYLDPA
jgi:hypothetical protein